MLKEIFLLTHSLLQAIFTDKIEEVKAHIAWEINAKIKAPVGAVSKY